MVPSLFCAMPEVNEAIPMPLGHGALEIGEHRKLGHSLREKRYDSIVLPNSFKSALVPSSRVFLIALAGAARCATVSSTMYACWISLAANGGNASSRWPMTKALCVPHKICRSHCYGRSSAGERR
ncbi:hypothetical protein ACVXHB_26165 [Escherichia coli]